MAVIGRLSMGVSVRCEAVFKLARRTPHAQEVLHICLPDSGITFEDFHNEVCNRGQSDDYTASESRRFARPNRLRSPPRSNLQTVLKFPNQRSLFLFVAVWRGN